MTNDINKCSDIMPGDLPQAKFDVFSIELSNENKYLNDKQKEFDSLFLEIDSLKKEIKPFYDLQHESSKKYEKIGDELVSVNQEIWELNRVLSENKNNFINSKIKSFFAKVVSSCVFLPFVFVLFNKMIGNPALNDFSSFIQYLIGFPVSVTACGILASYPFFNKIINKYENEYKKTSEYDAIISDIREKEIVRDSKDKEYLIVKEEMVSRNKIIDDYEKKIREINLKIQNLKNDVCSVLFNTPNNGELGISIEDFGNHHVLSMKI